MGSSPSRDKELFSEIENFFRITQYRYVITGGRAFLAYVNPDKLLPATRKLIMTEDYDVTVIGDDNTVTELVGNLQDYLISKELDLIYFHSRNCYGITQFGFLEDTTLRYLVDLHPEKRFKKGMKPVKLGGVYYPRLKWLIRELEWSIQKIQPYKREKRKTRRELILKMLNDSPHEMSDIFREKLYEICEQKNPEKKLKNFIGVEIKFKCSTLKY